MDLLNQVNIELNPCHDFYKFSCGNFLKNTNLERQRFRSAPDIMEEDIQSRIKNMLEQPVYSEQPRSLSLAKEFYRACMNESAIEAEGLKWMKQIFRRIGGWPILEEDEWKEEEFDWKKAVHKLKQMGINFEFFITLSVERDKVDPTKYVLQLSDPYRQHSLPLAEDIKRIYLRYMEDVAVYFGSSLVNARIEQQDVLEFTLKLAQKSEEGRNNNMSNLYNPFLLSELQYEFKSINWYDYLNGILSPSVKLKYDEQILMPDPYYLHELEHLMLNTSNRLYAWLCKLPSFNKNRSPVSDPRTPLRNRVLANFMAWHTLQHLIHFMPADLVNKAYEYVETINGEVLRKPRWEMCLTAAKDRMGPVISAAYIEHYFDEEVRREVTEMVHNIKQQYKKALQDFEWIDEATRKVTEEKLLDSAVNIVSFDDLNVLIQLCESYNDVKIYHDNILLSVMNLDQFALNAEFRKLRQPARTNWLQDPDFVTGLDIALSHSDDILVFPIGILGGLYYAKDRPKYSNYGALGSVVAKKVWQVFTETKYRELVGETRSWWSPASLLSYEERLKCVSRIFRQNGASTYHTKNKTDTREEELAYLIGAKVAYDTYKNWVHRNGKEPQLPGVKFTPEQLFWIYFAGPFCSKYSSNYPQVNIDYFASPEKIRVNGIIKNLQEFADDFDCESSDAMNSNEKCNIF
ncbi:hypothetical protein HHI36_017322 [Cryptolaemus montrouzieri]